MKRKMMFIIMIFLILCIGGWGSHLIWEKATSAAFEKEINSLTATIENVTPTGGTLRFRHANPEVFKNYEVQDYCVILKINDDNQKDITTFNKESIIPRGTPLVMDTDLSAVCEKNWQHLYGSLEPGEYKIVVLIRDRKPFRGKNLYSLHLKFTIN